MNVYAYVGPGLGMGAIGTLLAGAMAIFLAAVGLIWYPIKRLVRKIRAMVSKSEESSPAYSKKKPGQNSSK